MKYGCGSPENAWKRKKPSLYSMAFNILSRFCFIFWVMGRGSIIVLKCVLWTMKSDLRPKFLYPLLVCSYFSVLSMLHFLILCPSIIYPLLLSHLFLFHLIQSSIHCTLSFHLTSLQAVIFLPLFSPPPLSLPLLQTLPSSSTTITYQHAPPYPDLYSLPFLPPHFSIPLFHLLLLLFLP